MGQASGDSHPAVPVSPRDEQTYWRKETCLHESAAVIFPQNKDKREVFFVMTARN